jgi:bacterioferritin
MSSGEHEELVEHLNEDLESEFQSIVQYVQHIATLTGAEYMSIVSELRLHLDQEVGHATLLAEQVDFLGGVPTVRVPDVPSAPDTRSALLQDLALEERQLERYRNRVEEATAGGLVDVAEALRPLLAETQEHVRDLQNALGDDTEPARVAGGNHGRT